MLESKAPLCRNRHPHLRRFVVLDLACKLILKESLFSLFRTVIQLQSLSAKEFGMEIATNS